MLDTTLALLTGFLGTVFVIVLFGAALGGAWMLGRGWHRRDRTITEPSVDDLNSRKIAELMTRIEDLAVEVERSAEAQRYLAKTLAGGARAEPIAGAGDPMRAQERVVTPH
jgi:hypothetical protein